MIEMKERYVVYDIENHELIGEFERQDYALAFVAAAYNSFMVDNVQIQRILEPVTNEVNEEVEE